MSLVEDVELLLEERFEPSANCDDLAAVSDTADAEFLDVAKASEAFLVVAKVAVKPLLAAKSLLAVKDAEPVSDEDLLLAELLVASPAIAGPVVEGPLVVEPTLPEVLPPLAELLLEFEVALSVAVPFLVDAAKAAVAFLAEVAFAVVARLPFAANAASSDLVEVVVRPAFTVDPNAALLVVAEFFEALALNALDELLLALACCAEDLVSVLLFEVLKTFDVSLVYALESVVEVLREVFKLVEKALLLVTFEVLSIDN